MAKKTPAASKKAAPKSRKKETFALPASLAELKEDPKNPRTIEADASAALGTSLEEFGDISGIVFNVRSGTLVAGHQRVDQLRAAHGELALTADGPDEAWFQTPAGDRFRVRLVDWGRTKHIAAMVAANSQRIAGDFTDGLDALLLEVKDDNKELFDALLLAEINEPEKPAESSTVSFETQDVPATFQVVVEVKSERAQKKLYERLTGEGLTCKVLTT